jgi:hypothetical protein
MSNYMAGAYHPKEKVIRTAMWLDDHFGKYKYGVQFDGPGCEVFQPNDCEIPLHQVFVRMPKGSGPSGTPRKPLVLKDAVRTPRIKSVPSEPDPMMSEGEAQGKGVFMGAGTINHKILHSWLL